MYLKYDLRTARKFEVGTARLVRQSTRGAPQSLRFLKLIIHILLQYFYQYRQLNSEQLQPKVELPS